MAFIRRYFLRYVVLHFALRAFRHVEVHSQNVCPRTYYVQESRVMSQRFTTSCGFWGWSRCTRYRYYTSYISAAGTSYDCCNGWSKDANGRCQIAICESSCQNDGVCTSPDVCTCQKGYLGSTCNVETTSSLFKSGGNCLQGHVIKSIFSHSLSKCGAACKRNDLCKSFNYYKNDKRCELNGAGKDEAGGSDWVDIKDCAYYKI